MKKVELKLLSLKRSSILKLESTAAEIDEIVFELFSIFEKEIDYDNRKIKVKPFQKRTEVLTDMVYEYVDKYKEQMPQIYKFKKYIDSLDKDEYFCISLNTKQNTKQIVEIFNILEKYNNNTDTDIINKSADGLFGFVLDNYDISTYNGKKPIHIGVSCKKKRVCRFCHKTYPEVRFGKKAHAISEALGNKSIIANEECDSCNEKFGTGIENDIVAYLSFYRSFFGIKGKGSGQPKLKGANFCIQNTVDNTVDFRIKGDGKGEFPTHIDALTYERISLQNVYRVLCKYLVSVIDSSVLPSLTKTIDWINEDIVSEQLPKIKVQILNNIFSMQPSISIYIRKSNNKNIPHIIGEFHYACLVYVFVVPFSSQDDKQFLSDDEIAKYWDKLHYSQGEIKNKWTAYDFSEEDRKKLVFNIVFKEQNV